MEIVEIILLCVCAALVLLLILGAALKWGKNTMWYIRKVASVAVMAAEEAQRSGFILKSDKLDYALGVLRQFVDLDELTERAVIDAEVYDQFNRYKDIGKEGNNAE